MKSAFRTSMAWLHRWAGIVFSALMFFIFVTGTLGYFHFELDRWLEPERPLAMGLPTAFTPSPELNLFSVPTDRAPTEKEPRTISTAELIRLGAQRLKEQAPDDAAWWGIILPTERNGNFWVEWQPPRGEDGQRPEREAQYLDLSREEPHWVQPRQTGGGEALYRLHWRLHYLPDIAAYWIVGLCSLLMLVGLVTGVIIHRRIFREFFTLRLFRGARSWLDFHNLSSVLALPFQIMIVYSGLLFFALTFMEPIVSAHYGDEGIQAFQHEAFPDDEPEPRAGEPAESAPILPLLTLAQRESGQRIEQIYMLHPGDTSARLSFYVPEPSPAEYRGKPHRIMYRASTGERLEGGTQQYGGAASVEKTLIALHEGLFADWPLRWLYILCSLLGILMIATGILFWLKKRRGRDPTAYASVERFYAAVLVGLPTAISLYFLANRLLPAHWSARADWEMHSLFLGWLALGLYARWCPLHAVWKTQLTIAALAWGSVPVVNALTSDRHLGVSLAAGDWVLAGVDLSALVMALSFGLMARHGSRRSVMATEARRQNREGASC